MMGMRKIRTAIQEQLAEGVTLGETDAGRVVNMMNVEKMNELKADAKRTEEDKRRPPKRNAKGKREVRTTSA
jgi:hypothetical protein